jgi:biopolymer transport protein ExbD
VASLSDAADEDEGPLASINIIPFVDIVLVLLVIFMLTSATIVRASLKVELPKAASGGSKVETTLNLVLTKKGELSVNGAAVFGLPAAAQIVRREATANPKVQAVISADKGVEYGKVVELIDLVKQNGVAAFALDIERGAPPVAPVGAPSPSPSAPPPPPPSP